MPSPDNMHGAADGFGGEDTPHSPRIRIPKHWRRFGQQRPMQMSNEQLMHLLKNVNEISVAPGIVVEIDISPTHSIIPTPRRVTLVIRHESPKENPQPVRSDNGGDVPRVPGQVS